MEAKTLEWMMWRVEPKKMDEAPLDNLIQALRYFNKKYGREPNRVELSSDWLAEFDPPEGITITRAKTVRPGFLMIALDPNLKANGNGK